MTRWIALTGVVALGLAAVFFSEHRKMDVPPGPAALLYLIADTEQELTRMPVRFTRMSDEEEIRIGNQIARQYGFLRGKQERDTIEVERYLGQVGARVAAHAHRRLPYKFHYVPQRYFINAFAVPGGHVYVGEGLLALMDSEDELAAVVGHEIEHIDHYHCAERVQQEQALRKIPLSGLIALPAEIFEAGYSKDQELEADREGTRLAVQAGYSANGALRMFETFQRLYQEYQARAKTPQEELSRVALDTLGGYFRSHPLTSERIAQLRQMIASEHWELHPERDLAVAYIFQTGQARSEFEARKYAHAEQIAMRSLQMHPGQEKALQVLAEAQFAQADFAGAAASYRRLLELESTNRDVANALALSLAADNPKNAANEFRRSMDSLKGEKPTGLQVPVAGLELVSGNAAAAQKLRSELSANSLDLSAPTWLEELGWWYYMAGDSRYAAELLGQAIQQRPRDLRVGARLSWADIELRRFSDALQVLNLAYEQGGPQPERTMARAVALWRALQNDEALQNFESAIAAQPEWTNSRWVKALYSPLVSETIDQMNAERERRRKTQGQHKRIGLSWKRSPFLRGGLHGT
jgi:beta-barrel assembly-enhancing protease